MCHGVYVGFDAFALIIPLLFAIGMVVGQGSGGRKSCFELSKTVFSCQQQM